MAGHSATKNPGGRPKGPETKVVRLPVPIAALAKRFADRSLKAGDISTMIEIEGRLRRAVPLYSAKASCGFPSPADDYLDKALDFNELLIKNTAATFAVRIAGESMIDAGIFPGDIAIIDRSVMPKNGAIVLACIDNEFTVKRFRRRAGQVLLQAENKGNLAYRDISIAEGAQLEIWGVVTRSIRMHTPG